MKIKCQAEIQSIHQSVDPISLFAFLTQEGKTEGCCYFEIQDHASPYAGFTIGVCSSSLSVHGKNQSFKFTALNSTGEKILSRHPLITEGQLKADTSHDEFEARLTANNHRNLIAQLIPEILLPQHAPKLPLGIMGCFAFDFIKQIENLPDTQDNLNDPDYCFYLPENLFIYNSQQQILHLISVDLEIHSFAEQAKTFLTETFRFSPYQSENFVCEASEEAYTKKFQRIKNEILSGNVFQLVYGCLFQGNFSGSALAAFHQLKHNNPSDFMFYFRDHQGVLMGTSPESCLRVHQNIAELNPIAGSMPRGEDQETDQRLMINLLTNTKELSEHTMLLDLARNDLCSICESGSVEIKETFKIKRYQHIQHLVSRVSGKLRSNIDALQAYQATMNMGTLTGSPKPRALQLISELENQSRGYFGGGFGFITTDGNMETCIVIRSVRIKDDKVYLRAASGIVLDSNLNAEWNEIQLKAKSCIEALTN